MSEGASVETLVFRVVTTDVDDQLNGGIFYYISEGNGDHKFRIDESSGQIILNRPLDRERTSRCTLTVGARVDGSPTLSASTTVVIDVLYENVNPPKFMHNEAKLSTVETLAADLGVNSEIVFIFETGNMHDTFRIDPQTGVSYLGKAAGLRDAALLSPQHHGQRPGQSVSSSSPSRTTTTHPLSPRFVPSIPPFHLLRLFF